MRHRYLTLAILALIVVSAVFWPDGVSAAESSFMSFTGTVTQYILAIIASFLSGLVSLVSQLVVWLLRVLTPVILNPTANYGGVAVYMVWKLFRDLCNSFFIVFFILISFSTVFHTVWKGGHAFYYRPALINVIVAAILVNFSLPIGQTIVWGGNQAALLVGGLMQGVNIENRLMIALKIPQRMANASPSQSVYTVPDTVTPLNQQGVVQRSFTDAFTPQMKAEYEKCKANPDMQKKDGGCYGLFTRMYGNTVMQQLDEKAATGTAASSLINRQYKGILGSILNLLPGVNMIPGGGYMVVGGLSALYDITMDWYSWTNVPVKTQVVNIFTSMGNVILMTLIAISFLCVIVFMIARLPMIWFLLAASAIPCFMYAVPKSPRFSKWWGDLVGYSIFGPLYLFVVYIGLYVIELQGTLLQGLQNNQWLEGIFSSYLFTGIAVVLFVGGAKAAWDISFSFSSDLKTRVTKAGAAVGVSDKTMFGLKPSAAYVGRKLGVTPAYEGAKAGIQKQYAKTFTQPQQKRQEDIRAKWAGRFGDEKAAESLKRKRVQEQMTKNKELGLSTADLKVALRNKTDPTEYLAAAKELLDRGELPVSEMDRYVKAAAKVSPAYGNSAQEAVNKKLREQAKEKSFKTAAEALTAYRATDDSGRDKLLRDLKKNDILTYALLANEADTKLAIAALEGSGDNPLLPHEIIQGNLSKIDADTIGKAMATSKNFGWPEEMDAAFQERFKDLAADKNNYYKLIDGAVDHGSRDPESPNYVPRGTARKEAQQKLKQIREDALKAELDKARKVAEAGAEAQAEALVSAQERLEATRDDRARTIASRTPTDYSI